MRTFTKPTKLAITGMLVILFSVGTLLGAPGQRTIIASDSKAATIIDLSGKRIQSVYAGLQPSRLFREALLEAAGARPPGIKRRLKYQTLGLRQGRDDRQCALRTVAGGQEHPCNGHYMGPNDNTCPASCAPAGESYLFYYSQPDYPYESGYWYPPGGGQDCSGCVLGELGCSNL